MKTQTSLVIVLALVALFVIGCGSSPTPTPAPTQPPLVITVVITPTPLPPTATPAQPTLTPIPTLPLTSTVATAVPATKPPVAVKPTVARTATKPGPTATNTALPLRFAAPGLIEPLWEPPWNTGQKDEVKYPGSAMIFKWRAAGGLGGDECYLLNISSEPINANLAPHSDYFLVKCGDQTQTDFPVSFTLFQPGRGGPSYSSLMMDASEMWVSWTMTVVKNLGQCVDAQHCKSAALSPASYRGKFLFKGN